MKIIKQWSGKGGSIVARFYSCNSTTDIGNESFFLDFEGCTTTVSVTRMNSANYKSVVALLKTQGVSSRYIAYILKHFGFK